MTVPLWRVLGAKYITCPHSAPWGDYSPCYIWIGRKAMQYRAEHPERFVGFRVADVEMFEAWLLDQHFGYGGHRERN
jgi:hypothetical protein